MTENFGISSRRMTVRECTMQTNIHKQQTAVFAEQTLCGKDRQFKSGNKDVIFTPQFIQIVVGIKASISSQALKLVVGG